MALTIDELNIQITADSKNATRALTSLIKKLEQLKSTLSGSAVSNITIANSFNKTTNSINKAATATQNYENKTKKTTKSTKSFTDNLAQHISKWRTLYGAFNSAAQTMAGWFKESNSYVETLNLFRITMGDAAEESYKFAESVQSLIGIDIAEWMNYQGTFKQLTSGFGVAEESANTMSKNLTQLSYDLASFFDRDVEEAFDKLSSAMAGQVKGLREFGIDTTVASLQEYALAKGIETSVSKMTQAEKSLLRYNYIMEKSTKIQGDMARTLVTPANAVRILTSLLTQMRRALGDIVSVIVTWFIPYVQALVSIITDAAKAIASFFGFNLDDYKADLSDLNTGGYVDDLEAGEDALGGASDAAKKLKKQLMGFDELNILSNPDSDSSGSDSGGVGGALGGMQPLEYDFLAGLDTSKLDETKEKLKKILYYVELVTLGFTAWKITKLILDLQKAIVKAGGLKAVLESIGQKGLLFLGVTLAITGFALETDGIISAIKEGLNKVNFAEILGGGGTLIGGAALIGKYFGSALVGSAVGSIIAGVGMLFIGLWDAIKNGLSWLSGLLIPAGTTLMGAGIGALIGSIGGPMGAFIGVCVGLVIDGIILLVQNWETVSAWFVRAFTAIGQFFVDVWNGIVSVWNKASEWFDTWVIQPVVNFFVGLWTSISEAASDCWNAIVEFFTPAVEWFSELFQSIWQTISDIFYNIGVIAKGCWEIIKAVWGIVSEWFNTNIIRPVANFFSTLWTGIKNAAITAWEGIKSVFSAIGTWMNTNIIQPVSKFFSGLWDGFKEGAKKAWEGVKTVFSTVGTFFKNTFTNAWNGIVKIFSVAGEIFVDIKDGIVSAFKWVVNGIIRGLNSVISIPFQGINSALSWIKGIKIVGIQPFADLRTISIPQIPLLASGGFVDAGQMFIAREKGPELVGSIGKKTAVANNDQIISGIEAGVYRAMMAANSGNKGSSQTIRIINEIDGDVVGEKVIQYHNNRVMQVGASPLLV